MAYGFINYYSRAQGAQEYVLNKEKSIEAYRGYMINRLMRMFKYEGLPETIPQHILEYYLMVNGSCFITEHKKQLFAFLGSFGGEPDVYYRPTLYVVANPALKLDKSYDLWNLDGTQANGGVLMRNDMLWQGLNPLICRYAVLLAENTITLRTADIMLRVLAMLTAPDDKTRAAGIQYLKDIEAGKLGVIGENRLFEGIQMQSPPSNNGSYLTQFIELHQFLQGTFYNEVGLSSLINMKREAISTGEASLNEDSLMPLVETMLQCRQEDVSQLNELFGTNISVDFNSVWLENVKEREIGLQQLANGGIPDGTDGNSTGLPGDTGNGNESVSEPDSAGSDESQTNTSGDGSGTAYTDNENDGAGATDGNADGGGNGEPAGNPDESTGTDGDTSGANVVVEVNVNVNGGEDSETDIERSDDDGGTTDSESDSESDGGDISDDDRTSESDD